MSYIQREDNVHIPHSQRDVEWKRAISEAEDEEFPSKELVRSVLKK
jgi:hypothetical protein